MHWEAGGAWLNLVNAEGIAVSAHAVAVGGRAAAPLRRVMERAWLQAGATPTRFCTLIHTAIPRRRR